MAPHDESLGPDSPDNGSSPLHHHPPALRSGSSVEHATTFDAVCGLAVSKLGLVGAALTLVSSAGSHVVVGASGTGARRWEEVQFSLGEGPTADATSTGRPVQVAALENMGGRWPGFLGEICDEGVCAIFALPLQMGASSLGTLTLYRGRPGHLRAVELRAALVVADVAIGLLVDSTLQDVEPGPGLLVDEIDGQAHVFQAQGMVMVQVESTLTEALARMRGRAYADGVTLSALSHDIINGSTTFTKGD